MLKSIPHRMNSSKRCAVRTRDYETCRKRIRRGTARKCHEELFEMRTGKPATCVKRESPEQRTARLKRARDAYARQVKNETDKERYRRREADRIRHQLRRSCYYPRNSTVSAHDREALQEQLKEICKYPKAYPSGWWSPWTKERKQKDSCLKGRIPNLVKH